MGQGKKRCACGAEYGPGSWARLRVLGKMDNGRERGEMLDLRNCACGSSIAVPIGEHAPSSSPWRVN